MAEGRIQALARAVDKSADRSFLARIFASDATRPLAAAIDAGLRIIDARARGDSFGPAEGVLTTPAAREKLAGRFGANHPWSASQWELYAACPYKFFLEDVLGLEPLGDIGLEIDHRRRGSIVHDVLSAFHRRLQAEPVEKWRALLSDDAAFAAEMQATLKNVIGESSAGREGIDAALLELDRRQIEKWIKGYRDHHEKYDGAWAGLDAPMLPTHFELRFGQARPGNRGDEDPNSIDQAFKVDIGGEQVVVTGRIDRIDVGEAGGKKVFNVIDYKSGRRPTLTTEKIQSGECLQPALYVMAAQALVFNEEAEPMWAGYWSMKNGVTTQKKYSFHYDQDVVGAVKERIRAFVHMIRGGEFPVFSADEQCTSRCDFRTVCRVGQTRSLEKLPGGENKDAS